MQGSAAPSNDGLIMMTSTYCWGSSSPDAPPLDRKLCRAYSRSSRHSTDDLRPGGGVTHFSSYVIGELSVVPTSGASDVSTAVTISAAGIRHTSADEEWYFSTLSVYHNCLARI